MAEKPKFRFYTQTSFTILYLEDYQLEIQTIITGKRKQTRVFMSESGSLNDFGKRKCIYEDVNENYICTPDDFPKEVHPYLQNPQKCIDEYLALKNKI